MKSTASIKILKGVAEMRRFSLEARQRGARIGLVPTMGALHAGHLALVKAARKRADTVVVSIFVNPTQFGPREDLSSYPRDLAGDVAKLRELGVAAVFAPEAAEMFPPGHRSHVEVEDLSNRLFGRARPTHFRGVATVVAKFLAIVQPHQAWFGQKDYQQLLVVRNMARDLNLDVEILDVPTVRDADGLALSSRNAYLTPEQRPAALSLQLALQVARRIIAKGERSAAKIISNLREGIRAQPGTEIEYIALCHPETLHDLDAVEVRTLIALAVRVGRARLIDNALIDLRELGSAPRRPGRPRRPRSRPGRQRSPRRSRRSRSSASASGPRSGSRARSCRWRACPATRRSTPPPRSPPDAVGR